MKSLHCEFTSPLRPAPAPPAQAAGEHRPPRHPREPEPLGPRADMNHPISPLSPHTLASVLPGGKPKTLPPAHNLCYHSRESAPLPFRFILPPRVRRRTWPGPPNQSPGPLPAGARPLHRVRPPPTAPRTPPTSRQVEKPTSRKADKSKSRQIGEHPPRSTEPRA